MDLILITGVNGYIGSKIAEYLLNKDYKVIGTDINNSNCNFLLNNPKFRFIQMNIVDPGASDLKNVNILIHCAGLIHSGIKGHSQQDYFNVNVEGTKNIISALTITGLKQIIFLSSVSVYGELTGTIVPDEKTKPEPRDFYGKSKLSAENEIIIFGQKNNIPYTILRLTPVYGVHKLANIYKRIYLPKKSAFYKISSGDQRLSFCSIFNVIELLSFSVMNRNFFNEIFIVKDEEDYSINEIIRFFKQSFFDRFKPVIWIPLCILNSVISIIGLFFPNKKEFFKYQLTKVTKNFIYSNSKLKAAGIELTGNLTNTFKKCGGTDKFKIYFFLKRTVDIFISFFALLLMLPVFIVIIAVLKFTGEGEVFFMQTRIGKGNKNFKLLKFATMLKNSPKTGTVTVKNDPRILPLGHFLRNTKINELPQLINVLRGDMSLIGFRPLAEEVFEFYPEEVKKTILKMKPGLTGIGSIIFRNEEEILFKSKKEKMVCYKEDIIPLKGALEKWYAEHCSFGLDFKILLATIIIVLFKKLKFQTKWFPIESILKQSTLQKYFI